MIVLNWGVLVSLDQMMMVELRFMGRVESS